jgi:hypothetical protein
MAKHIKHGKNKTIDHRQILHGCYSLCKTLTAQQESSVEDLPKLKRCTAFINVQFIVYRTEKETGFHFKKKTRVVQNT